jgi:HD-GYP domain-containing protein (c-di-GMP phosphodiesterase class II)
VGALGQREVDCVTFVRGISATELAKLCQALAVPPDAAAQNGGTGRRLTDLGAPHILIDGLALVSEGRVKTSRGLASIPMVELRNSALAVARQTMQTVRADQPIDAAASTAMVEEMVSRVTGDRSAAVSIACVKGHDEYTFAHSVHAALLSVAFGDAIGLTPEELRDLGTAAMLHDVGKVLVPTEVLRKPGRLSAEEWELMGRHPVDGAAVLLESDGLPAVASLVAFEHHIGCDQSGYPRVRRRREMSLWSMIVSMADVYDALTTHRPYRAALSPEEAAAELQRLAGGKCDPQLVGWFREMLGVYPPGTCVRLDTGECGVVCRHNPADPSRPGVCVFSDAQGRPVFHPYEVSLEERRPGADRHQRSIASTEVPPETRAQAERILDAWLRGECLSAEYAPSTG